MPEGGAAVDAAAMAARLAGGFVFGAFVAVWVARALFKWILGMSGISLLVLIVATAVGGGVLGVAAALEERHG
jgi:hypothetical protein